MIKSTSIKRAFINKIINETDHINKGSSQGTDMNIKLFKMDYFLGNEYTHNRSKSNSSFSRAKPFATKALMSS